MGSVRFVNSQYVDSQFVDTEFVTDKVLTHNLSTNMYFVDKSHIYLLTLINVDSWFVDKYVLCRQIAHLSAYTNKCWLTICQKLQRCFNNERPASFSSCCDVPFHPILIGKNLTICLILVQFVANILCRQIASRHFVCDTFNWVGTFVDLSRVNKSLPTQIFYLFNLKILKFKSIIITSSENPAGKIILFKFCYLSSEK